MALPLLGICAPARALSQADANAAVRAALDRGAEVAVRQLGQRDGFLGNDKIRIPLPDGMDRLAPLLRSVGRGRQVDELLAAMNHAAENAVAQALPMLRSAIRAMTWQDARQILEGGDHSVTDFFSSRTRAPLTLQFRPLVAKAVERLSLVQRYNEVAGKAVSLGLLKSSSTAASIEQHVTGKALDGLYFAIGEEELRIRRNPLGTGSELLRKVFSGLSP